MFHNYKITLFWSLCALIFIPPFTPFLCIFFRFLSQIFPLPAHLLNVFLCVPYAPCLCFWKIPLCHLRPGMHLLKLHFGRVQPLRGCRGGIECSCNILEVTSGYIVQYLHLYLYFIFIFICMLSGQGLSLLPVPCNPVLPATWQCWYCIAGCMSFHDEATDQVEGSFNQVPDVMM